MLTQHEGFHYAFRVLDEVVVVDGETAGLEPHRVNLDRYLLKHEKWAGDATLEAWERVVSKSGTRAGARIKVGNANRAGDLAIKES